jgi:DNA-binding NtrC family response regulator
MKDTILIVDDEADLLHGLKRLIVSDLDCQVVLADNGPDALAIIREHPVDVVLADIRMPGMDGIRLLQKVREFDATITVIIMTAFGSVERAVTAIKAGAFDFIQKPFDEERLIHLVKNGLERNRLVRENSRLLQALDKQTSVSKIIGQSQPMRSVLNKIKMLAKTDITVLIRGETGTGKELAGQAIHAFSQRRRREMVTVNCPALPETILESELFGYKKGAFTNALSDKRGMFDQAQGSTIFLDEIGDLSPAMQSKLLRVLQEKQITPLGATTSHQVDVRIIAATNQNLEKKIEKHEFREDLYYRLNVASLTMPSLEDIKEDLPMLVEHFLTKIACEQDTTPKSVTPEVMNELLERSWPGNIRELENTIREWYAMIPGPVIKRTLSSTDTQAMNENHAIVDLSQPYKDLKARAIEAFTRRYLHQLLEHTRGNITSSAKVSGIKRQSLQKIIKRYHIRPQKFRA